MQTTTYISRKHFNLWYDIFKVSSGRFTWRPLILTNSVQVQYKFDNIDDCNDFERMFQRLSRPIVETRSSVLKRLKMKLKGLFK